MTYSMKIALTRVMTLLVIAAAPSSAHAQLGGLKKAAKQAAAQAAVSTVAGSTTESSDQAAASAPRAKHTNDFVLEMTEPVVARLETALAAEATARTEVAAILAKQPDENAYAMCQHRAALLPEMEKALETYMADVEKANGNTDAIMKASAAMEAALKAVYDRECGIRLTHDEETELQKRPHLTGAEAGDFMDTQYAILKERVPPLCGSGTNLQVDANGGAVPIDARNSWVYSAAELEAITPKCVTLMSALVAS